VTVNRDGWVRFMMRESWGGKNRKRGGGAKRPEYRGLLRAGRLVPLLPYFFPCRCASRWNCRPFLTLFALACSATAKADHASAAVPPCRPAWWGAGRRAAYSARG